ncbi:UvrD-helicase domain-containing protein [Sulfuriroseicoccus oceanibius]|uniref:DNA 3'-5' helicase n=1 Tax=Sulfuriroseicoccus oceanibius TaxID=2707525 RepID=A0A6B3L8Q7_9BACT|nr:UvrD-helicase domain-containing protein [Sulfuriroseicoccus oceanibius]QQL43841.1 UvrD-helicase domain-containing protein [Sulfuriroseicoccus oceanibius]
MSQSANHSEIRSMVIEASAGSGKTYQLANRFLALLAAGVKPEHIIALTFTRKAAGEFTERILSRLALAAGSPDDAGALASDIVRTWNGDGTSQPAMFSSPPALVAPDAAGCLEMLKAVVDSLDRITLSTLDSFFLKVVRQFSFELGLSGFELLDDQQQAAARERVLQDLFNSSGANEKGRDNFLQAFKLATYGKEVSQISSTLEKYLESQHERIVNAPEESKWANLERLFPNGIQLPMDIDRKAELAVARGEVPAMAEGARKGYDKRWIALIDQLEAYSPGNVSEIKSALFGLLCEQLDALRAGAGEDVYYKKSYPLTPNLSAAMFRVIGNILFTELKVIAGRTLGLYGVLSAYENAYDEQVRRYGQLGFSDLTQLLAGGGVDLGSRLEELHYRLDSHYDHWLLDEFQDTSMSQWNVVEALLGDAVLDAEGRRSLFMVGDAKQGIYGWRGGDVRLFGELMERADWAPRRDVWPMSKSWRSSQVVLDLVNQICDPQLGSMGRFPAAAVARWRYQHHEAAKDLSGFAEVVAIDAKASAAEGVKINKADKDEATLDALAARVKRIDPLRRGLSCAVLVRSGAHADLVVEGLRSRLGKGFPVELDSEVSIGEDSPLGRAITDFFRWLRTPADTFASNHVWMTPLAPAMDALGETPSKVWGEAVRRFSRHGAAGLMELIVTSLSERGGLSELNANRLQDIHRAAERFDAVGGTIAEWVGTLEYLKRREHSRKGTVQVMTIHKSKGLEFDAVMLPFVSSDAFDHKGRVSMIEQRGARREVVNQIMRPADPVVESNEVLGEMMAEWSEDQCYEGFCLVYVALTRAARSLHVLVEATPGNDDKANPRDWIIGSVGDGMGVAKGDLGTQDEHVLYSEGDADWFATAPPQEQSAPSSAQAVELGTAVARRKRRSPSDHSAEADGEGAAFPTSALASRAGMRFGSEVHALFERIRWADDAPAVLDSVSSDAATAVVETLAAPAVAAWFARRDRVEVSCERPIEAVIDGVWISGVIDRLEVERNATGTPVAARIIDFKTDRVDSEDVLITRYSNQLQTYRRMVALALELPPTTITCALVSTALKAVVEV